MTRNRPTSGSAGRVVFVGAGPGDPGMLTARATAALAQATLVLVDPDVSAAVQDAVRGSVTGPLPEAAALGRALATDLLDRGAAELMAVSR